jgi:hypothetical protein
MFGGYCGDNAHHALDFSGTGTQFDSFGSTFGPDSQVTCLTNLYGTSQIWRSHGDWIGNGSFTPSGTGSAAVCSWGAGNIFNALGSYVVDTASNGNGYACQVSGPLLIASGTTFTGAGSGGAINNVNAGCLFKDLGGNSFTNGIVNSVAAPIYGSASITGATLATGGVGLTSGWSSSTVTAASGDSHSMTFTITLAGTPTTGAVATVTFPTAYLAAPKSCIQQSSGTQVLTSVAVGTPSTTAVTFTYTGTLTAANTIIENVICQ